MNERLTIKTQIKKALRDVFIGKYFTRELGRRDGKHVERTEFYVQHLFFGENEILFLGDYSHPYGYVSLSYRDAVDLADNWVIKRVYGRSEIIEGIYFLTKRGNSNEHRGT